MLAIIESAALGLRTILPRTERGGTNIADGYARISGKVGVNALTSGPGVENAFAGIAQAYSDNSPLLVLAGQARRSRLGAGDRAGFHPGRRAAGLRWARRRRAADRLRLEGRHPRGDGARAQGGWGAGLGVLRDTGRQRCRPD